VKLAAGGFLGAEAIRARAAAGLRRRLVGFVLEERGIARAEMPLTDERGAELGAVTSGAPSPTLGKSIGLGYVPPAFAPVGTPLRVRIRDRAVQARVVETPFVSRGRA
jgi:aminomethyltransferase